MTRLLVHRATPCALAFAMSASAAFAHPHVFIDGGVNFVVGPGRELEAIEVTWLYDEFETLYMLASHGMDLNAQGALDETDRQELVRRLSDWPADFDGSAHLTSRGEAIALDWPQNLDAELVDGRLQLTFDRILQNPIKMTEHAVEAAFFERTYFFDFTVTNTPEIRGLATGCAAEIIPFDPTAQDKALLDVLAKLSREETSDIENVGGFFADRIVVKCD